MATWIASRPLVVAGPAAVLGVVAARHPLPAGTVLLGLAAALIVLGGPARRQVLPLLAAAACGLASAMRTEERARRDFDSLERARTSAAGPRTGTAEFVVERCDEDPFRMRSWAAGRTVAGLGVLAAWPGRLPEAVLPGTRIRVSGRFSWPRPPGNPGVRDARRSLAFAGAAVLADLRTVENLEVVARGPPGVGARLASLRRRAARRLTAQLPADVAPIAAALLLGIRSGRAEETLRRFERSGTMHLLAISGMHLVLFAGLVHGGIRRLGGGRRCAAGVTLALVLAYVPVAGAGAPVRRAATGIAVYAVALFRGRPADGPSATAGAALLLALGDPVDVFRVGFRLSFAAVIGIQLLAPVWQERWGRRHRLLRRFPAVRKDRPLRLAIEGYLLGALPVSLAAWCATAPFVAAEFGTVAPWAPLVNLLAAPLLAPLLPALALHAAGVDAAGGMVVALVRTLCAVLELAGALPGALLSVPPVPPVAVLAWCTGVVTLRGRPIAAAWAVALFATALALVLPPRARDGCALVVLDVGHGQAILLRFDDGDDVLVDAGSRGRPDAGRRLVLPALRALGVHRLAAVVCSHDDADHWNALPAVLATMPVGRLLVESRAPPHLLRIAEVRGVPVQRARSGALVKATARATLHVVAAGETGIEDDNDRSVALLFRVDDDVVLLPADRESAGLDALLEQPGLPLPPVLTALIAPHHGARCERASLLGARFRPRYVLVSTGPDFADTDTLRAFGSAVVARTDRRGCLVLRWSGAAPAQPRLDGFRDAE